LKNLITTEKINQQWQLYWFEILKYLSEGISSGNETRESGKALERLDSLQIKHSSKLHTASFCD
jgi:hypothetical protein